MEQFVWIDGDDDCFASDQLCGQPSIDLVASRLAPSVGGDDMSEGFWDRLGLEFGPPKP